MATGIGAGHEVIVVWADCLNRARVLLGFHRGHAVVAGCAAPHAHALSIPHSTIPGILGSVDQKEKVRENRLRRVAARRGFDLHRTRRLDHQAADYGTYTLKPHKRGKPKVFEDIDAVERFLAGEP
jgi:hypothetical protein